MKTPQLRIAVIPFCNLKCFYCHPEGEGYGENLSERMTPDEIGLLVGLCAKVGFTHVKFTGGEPLLRRDMEAIVASAGAVSRIQEVQMVTNGALLAARAERLRDAGLNSITISIDGADPAVYERVRGGALAPVLDGLRRCRDVGLPVRINTVLTRRNFDQVVPLMKLAERFEASLKFLDLTDLQFPGSGFAFEREFVPFQELAGVLESTGGKQIGLEEAPGGVGAPLVVYLMPSGQHIVMQDSMLGGNHHPSCYACASYPCQDALISVRVTHDGHLKRCLIRNDNLVDVLTPLRAGDLDLVVDRVRESFDVLVGSTFQKNAWRPKGDASAWNLRMPPCYTR